MEGILRKHVLSEYASISTNQNDNKSYIRYGFDGSIRPR